MSDAQRRLLCRFALVAFCAVPTFFALSWALFPRSIAQWQTRALHLLSCPVEIGRVETPTPNQLVFRSFRLGDAESQTWTEFETVEWRQSLNKQQLELSDVDLSLSQFTSLMRLLWEQVPQVELGTRQIELHVGRITIRSDLDNAAAGPNFVFQDCWIRIDPGAAQPRLTVEFFTEQKSDNPVRWETIFGHHDLPTCWSLNTNNNALPCWLVSHAWPTSLRLGDRSWFNGYLSGKLSRTENSFDVSSLQLLDIDPAKLIDTADPASSGDPTPSIRLASNARCDVVVDSAHLIDGRLESTYFKVHCQQGQLANRLLQSAKHWLHIDVIDANTDEFVDFSQLVFGVEIRDGKLNIQSQVPDGAIARGLNQQPLLFATTASVGLAPHCLAGWLAGEGQVQLPVSAASLQLMSHLPILR